MYLIVSKILIRQDVIQHSKIKGNLCLFFSTLFHSSVNCNFGSSTVRKLINRPISLMRYRASSCYSRNFKLIKLIPVQRNERLPVYYGYQFYSQSKKTHTCGELCKEDNGKFVTLRGFLQYQRMGVFCLLRDYFGLTQVIVNDKENSKLLMNTHYESYMEVSGEVRLRPVDQINKSMKTGEIEVIANRLKVLSLCKKDVPFLIRNHNRPTEQLGLKYRYLDLRQQYLQENLRFRSKLGKRMRDFLQDVNEFVEITTPTLSFDTPGGSQEFVVPTQLQNRFYSLVQSPQTYKQLAVIGGFEKYFQFAICYRDEGGRSDRQPEFLQLDLEMVDTTANEVQNLMEEIIIRSWPEDLPVPASPFPSITFEEAMENYGVDKPDLRFQWRICDVSNIISQSDSRIFSEAMKEESGVAKAFIVPGGEKFITKGHIQSWEEVAKSEAQLPGVIVLNVESDTKLKGKAAKALSPELSSALIETLGAKGGDTIVLAAGTRRKVLKLLGKLRLLAADTLEEQGQKVRDGNTFNFVWVVDFPLFERDELTGSLLSCHHPFTAPIPDHVHLLKENPLQVRSQHYDLVLNGSEIAGGSIRMHDANLQRTVLEILGVEFSQMNFFLEALFCGAPPHGGIALGFDRYISILRGSKSVRDVMAFPKTSDGKCLMSGAPSVISENDKNLYHLGQEPKK